MSVRGTLCCSQERLQLYRKKVQKVESEKWLSENKRSLAVDVSAANRFISHAIPELTPQQHEALRLVNSLTSAMSLEAEVEPAVHLTDSRFGKVRRGQMQ